MMKRYITGVVVATTVVAAACTSTPEGTSAEIVAPVKADALYTPVVSLNEIMVYVVDPHANELWDAAMSPPTTDAGWQQLNHAAVALAASGNLTKLGGNGPTDPRWTREEHWQSYSQGVAEAGLAAVKAVNAQDATALTKAGDELVLTCITCHREYKLDVPKIWTERQFPPEEQRP